MRIFVGIPLPDALQEKVAQWQDEYQRRFSPEGIRWIEKKNLHVTLLPPWQENTVGEIIRKLKRNPIASLSFRLTLDTILFMPYAIPKYIWGKGQVPESLLLLRDEIAQRLKKEVEKRPFALHTTIGRLNNEAVIIPIEEDIQWDIDVRSFALLQSQLLSQGAEYKILAEFPLAR